VAISFAAVSVGTVSAELGRSGGSRSGPPPVAVNSADRVLTQRTSSGAYAHVWTATDTQGLQCRFLQLGQPNAGFDPNRGGVCGPVPPPASDPIELRLSWISVGDQFAPIVAGSLAPRIRTLELTSSVGAIPLQVNRGFFVGELPASDTGGSLSAEGAPFVLVAYDGAGREARRIDLTELVDSVAVRGG
jgi:hypothetical protein